MLRTRACNVLAIEVPVMQAAIWPATVPELVAAVSEAGGLGSIGAVFEPADSVRTQIRRVREMTSRPFAVNHVVPLLDEEAFEATLEAQPAVVSFALGEPGGLVERAHAAGAKVIHQVHTVGQARRAAELGVDVIIAQGSEAGGQGLSPGVGAMVLIPQVAEAVNSVPVFVAGGVADGRGLAAALVLGAQGPTWVPGSWPPRRPPPTRDGSGLYSRRTPRASSGSKRGGSSFGLRAWAPTRRCRG